MSLHFRYYHYKNIDPVIELQMLLYRRFFVTICCLAKLLESRLFLFTCNNDESKEKWIVHRKEMLIWINSMKVIYKTGNIIFHTRS